MTRAEIEQKIHEMLDEIEASRIGMTKGEIPDLADYPTMLAQLSADVTALPDEDSVELKELLKLLREDLSLISWEMGEIARRLRDGDEGEIVKDEGEVANDEASATKKTSE